MLAKVKMALRLTDNTFDTELQMLIEAAKLDLRIAGVTIPETLDAIVELAIITYCRLHFGQPDNYDTLERSYNEQKAQLSMATGYTNFGG